MTSYSGKGKKYVVYIQQQCSSSEMAALHQLI